MSLIETKRNELEQFIKEQMIGPGGCAGRFGREGLPVGEEVINTTPGSIYNTAILFPMKEGQSNVDDANSDPDADTLVEKEDDFTFERRFPNAIAISCCLNENTDLNNENDVHVAISGRYYRKINGDEKKHVYISVSQEHAQQITGILEQHDNLRPFFSLVGLQLFIHVNNSDSAQNCHELVKELNKSLARQLYDEIITSPWGTDITIREEYLYLSTWRRKLFEKLKNRDLHPDYLTEIKQKIDLIGLYEQIIQEYSSHTPNILW